MNADLRRLHPRVELEAMCWEVVGDYEATALVVDLSADGARLERPFVGGRIEAAVPLQLEVPGLDEVVWARGDVVFDRLVPDASAAGGPFGLVRRTGYRLAVLASRERRWLRELLWELHRPVREATAELALASCYARG